MSTGFSVDHTASAEGFPPTDGLPWDGSVLDPSRSQLFSSRPVLFYRAFFMF